MKTKICRNLAPVALFIAVSASAPAAEDPAQLSSPEKWVLASWTSDVEIPVQHRPSISFAKGKFQGNSGVNHMSGRFTAKADGGMVIKLGAMTEMAGPPAAMKVESTFTDLLAKVTRWKVDDKTLVLSDGTPEMQLRFGPPEAEKNFPLIGTEWTLKGFEMTEGEAVSFTPPVEGTTITFSIAPDGRASGSAGVNRYFGKAEPGAGDKITFGPMASTRRGGPPKAMAQERDYLKQLQAVTNWAVDGRRLVLADADRSFGLVYEVK